MYTEKDVLVKNMFTNGLNIGLSLRAWAEKTVYGENINWLSCKEKVQGAAISKEGHADNVLGHEMTHHYWFP